MSRFDIMLSMLSRGQRMVLESLDNVERKPVKMQLLDSRLGNCKKRRTMDWINSLPTSAAHTHSQRTSVRSNKYGEVESVAPVEARDEELALMAHNMLDGNQSVKPQTVQNNKPDVHSSNWSNSSEK
jgi:hypothetical protein